MQSPSRIHGAAALASSSAAYCAIDFGTSNSAIAIVAQDALAGPGKLSATRLVALEGEQVTIPSAVFYDSEDRSRRYGRSAISAYVDGHAGRLMRSLKSILGSALIEETTQLGDGIALRYIDVIGAFLKHLKTSAEYAQNSPLTQVVLGRPVYFVDDDPAADQRAEDALAGAARAVGFTDVSFQFEPVAAALNYERQLQAPRTVLVADIGGGTSDFTVMRLGQAAGPASAHNKVLANHGVHVAGTDFDQRIELDAIMPSLGFRSATPEGREVPNRIYFDLATWHLINSVYAPKRVAELRAMKHFYAKLELHRRLLGVVEHRLGHHLVAKAESAKIELSLAEQVNVDLTEVEAGLAARYSSAELGHTLASALDAIKSAAIETVNRAGLRPDQIDTLYFTGGSTGLKLLSHELSLSFANAEPVFGDPFASVASGLGIEATQRYGSSH